MRVVKFEAENFGPHERIVVEFRPGLNVVVGRNGSGKSTLVDGLYAAVTGDFPGDGNQSANVRQRAPKGARCYVSASVSHAGTDISILRRVSPSAGRQLLVNGQPPLVNGQPARTADEVNETLWNALGVTKAVLTDYAFVRQWEAFGVLTATPAVRLKILNRLFGVDQVDRAYTAVDARLSGLSGLTAVPPERLQEAERRLAAAVANLTATEEHLSRLPSADWCSRVIADRTAAESVTTDRRRLEERLVSLLDQHRRALEQHDRLRAEAAEAATALEAATVKSDAAQNLARELSARQAAWNSFDAALLTLASYERRKADLLERVAAARQVLDAMPVVSAEQLESARRHLAACRDDWTASRRAVEANRAAGGETCPTCRSPITAEYRTWFTSVQSQLNVQAERASAAEVEFSRLETASLTRAEAARRLETAVSLSESIGPPPVSPPTSLTFEKPSNAEVVSAVSNAESARSSASLLAIRRESRLAQAEAQARDADRLQSESEAVARAIDAMPPAPPEVSSADFQYAVDATARRASLEAELAAYRRDMAAADADVRAYRKLVAEGQRRSAAADHFQQLKDVFRPGPGGLAAKVVDLCLSNLSRTLNTRLEQFGAPFTVRTDNQAALTAVFSDGTCTPAGRLSGGQKMILALAFRLSVLSEYGGDLGFLCLDEPTVGMDDANRAGLTRCLAEVGRWAAAGDSQLIIVTHDTNLAAAADHVIRLG